jgi:hypothetical protein
MGSSGCLLRNLDLKKKKMNGKFFHPKIVKRGENEFLKKKMGIGDWEKKWI